MTITGVTPNVGPVGIGPNPVVITNPDGASSRSSGDVYNAFTFTAPPTALPGTQPTGPPAGAPPNPSPVVQAQGPILSGGAPLPNPQSVRGGAPTNPHGQVPVPAPPHR